MKKLLVVLCTVLFTVLATSAYGQRKISHNGRKFIQNIEKCSLERYWDNGGWSIGYGHHMTGKMKQYKKITKAKAIELLNEDLKNAERIANKIVNELKWRPSQSFFDGLVSVIYNCGGGIYKTDFYKRLKNCRSSFGIVNKNDFHFTVAAIKHARIPGGKYAEGVKSRRYLEHQLMLS